MIKILNKHLKWLKLMILCSRLRRRKIPMWVMGVGSSQADRNKGLRLLGPF